MRRCTWPVERIGGVPVVCRRAYRNGKEARQGKRYRRYCVNIITIQKERRKCLNSMKII